MAADGDRERAVKEVAQVYERIKAHHPLLLLQYCSSPSTTTTHHHLAQSLLGDALRALNVALSVMKQQTPAAAAAGGPVPMTPRSVVVKAEPHQLSPRSPASDESQAAVATTITARRAKKRRSSSMMTEQGKTSSWVDFTTVPYEDGYGWRKYGEKKINGTSYTRSYFRCTYKDDTGCLATKHVQQKDTSDDDSPMFQVTYNNHHTCSSSSSSSSSSKGAAAAAMNTIKQEQPPPVLLPPLIEVSAALPFDGTPLLMSSSPCISGESCSDQYSDMVQMAEAAELASAGDDFLYDLKHYFLLGDHSFNIY